MIIIEQTYYNTHGCPPSLHTIVWANGSGHVHIQIGHGLLLFGPRLAVDRFDQLRVGHGFRKRVG